LANADLSYATFDDVVMTSADLTGADLTGATFRRCHLRGVQVEGSHWARAALLGTEVDGDPRTSPWMGDVVVAEAARAEVMVAHPGSSG
jgi:uncharacterized protein YjbI with pentapeptide repeats